MALNNLVVAVTATAVSAVAVMSFISSPPNFYCDAFTTMTPITAAATTTTTATTTRSQPSLSWKLYSSSLQSQQVAGTSKKKKNKKSKKNKKNKKKGNTNTNAGGGPPRGQPVSLEQLKEHVSSKYIHGGGGPLNEKVRKRGLKSNKKNGETTASSSTATTTATTAAKASSTTKSKSSKKTRANLDATSDSSTYAGLWDQEQEDFLKMLNGRPALVLNADYMVSEQ